MSASLTILANNVATDVPEAFASEDGQWVRLADLSAAAGMELKSQGVCVGEACFPLTDDEKQQLLRADAGEEWVDLTGIAKKLGQPVVLDADARVLSLGTIPHVRQTTLESAIAPDFELPDRQGNLVRLSDLRGRKVLITTWASW